MKSGFGHVLLALSTYAMSFCCMSSCQLKSEFETKLWITENVAISKINFCSCKWPKIQSVETNLVENISLTAQVQVRQDPCGSDVSDRETRLRNTGRNQRGLAFTQAWEKMRELSKSTWETPERLFRPLIHHLHHSRWNILWSWRPNEINQMYWESNICSSVVLMMTTYRNKIYKIPHSLSVTSQLILIQFCCCSNVFSVGLRFCVSHYCLPDSVSFDHSKTTTTGY